MEPLNINFVGYQRGHINHLQDKSKKPSALISILKKFHNNVHRNLIKVASSSIKSHTTFAIFQNIKEDGTPSNNKDGKQLNQPNAPHSHNNLSYFCGIIYQFSDCPYIIKSKRPSNWTPDPVIKKKFDTASQNAKINIKGIQSWVKKQKEKESKAQDSTTNTTDNSTKKIFYSATYSASTFTLSLTTSATATIISETNINHTNIFRSSWIHNTGANTHITCTLDKYTKDRDTGPGNYIIADKKSIKVDSYEIFIIAINTPNDPDTIIFADTAYYSTFLANVTSAKYFQFKKIYLDEKHSRLHKKEVIQYLLKKYNGNFFL